MFCPFCNRQNKEDAVFCNFCGKALPQQSFVPAANQSSEQSIMSNPSKKSSKPGFKLSDNAIKGIITAVAIVVLVLVVLVVYYPNLMPWNS
jgi:uncharacterized membrane protein YvbJ